MASASSVSSDASSIARAIQKFIEDMTYTPVDQPLDNILENAIVAEHELRLWFKAGRKIDDPFIGLINIFALHPAARRTRARPAQQESTQHYILPLSPHLRKSDLMPSTVYNISEFREKWDLFSHKVLSEMRQSDWQNVIAAGGAVLASLMAHQGNLSRRKLNDRFQSGSYAASDIDIFLWGLTPEQAELKMQDIYKAVRRAAPWPVTCVRKARTVSIHTIFPFRPVQIILRLYQSPAEILAGFDIDAPCCAYDGNNVWVNPRALVALVRQANTIDTSRRSPSYEFRLAKYADRGFEVYFPSLKRDRVSPSLYSPDLESFPYGLARLLVLEAMVSNPALYTNLHYRKNSAPTTTLPRNDYDDLWWSDIPYGPSWTPANIALRLQKMEAKINSPYNPLNAGKSYHRHVFIIGNMRQCLRPRCEDCPLSDDDDTSAVVSEFMLFIRGPIRFMTINPSKQILTSSYRPIESGDWTSGAYNDRVNAAVGGLRDIAKNSIAIADYDDGEGSEASPSPGINYASQTLEGNVHWNFNVNVRIVDSDLDDDGSEVGSDHSNPVEGNLFA